MDEESDDIEVERTLCDMGSGVVGLSASKTPLAVILASFVKAVPVERGYFQDCRRDREPASAPGWLEEEECVP